MRPGGHSDKLGNRYESWWTVYYLTRMIAGEVLSMRLEDPHYDKAEFTATTTQNTELHQTKRSNTNGKWSLVVLGNSENRILQSIYKQLAGNSHSFHFVSGSDSPELNELSERSRDALNFDEFISIYLEGQGHRTNFDRLLNFWNAEEREAYEILRRVHVSTRDEATHQEMVNLSLGCLFLTSRTEIIAELRAWTHDRVGFFTRNELMEYLQSRGFLLRQVRDGISALPLVEAITSNYLEGVQKKLIRGASIRRKVAENVWQHFLSQPDSFVTPLLGRAGSGKSGCIFQLVQIAKEQGITTLAFRLDRLNPVTTTTALGDQLELEESPALVLAAIARKRPSLLIIDQLDAVSTTSGRNAEFLQVIERLLDEVRGLRERSPIHVVLACRHFDWENDPRLRGLVKEANFRFQVEDFTENDVKRILGSANYAHNNLTTLQLNLLRLPQNLALFLDCPEAWDKLGNFGSTKDLFDAYWDSKREEVRKRVSPEPDIWSTVLSLLTERLTNTQLLSAPREIFDAVSPNYLRQMVSEGVLSFDGKRYGFGHESFFDYCFARSFIQGQQTLVEFLAGSEQHLFRRAQIRQVLAYLRDEDSERYCREVDSLISSDKVRVHIKDISLFLLVNAPEVMDAEWLLLEPWIQAHMTRVKKADESDDPLCLLIWRHFYFSQSWFLAANARGLIEHWLSSSVEAVQDIGTHYLSVHQRRNGKAVAILLEPYADIGGKWPLRLKFVMEWSSHENDRRFFDLFLRLIDNGVLDEAKDTIASNGTFWSMLHGLGEDRPDLVPEVLGHWLRRRFEILRLTAGAVKKWEYWQELFGHDQFGINHVHNAGNQHPELFVHEILPIALEISEAASSETDASPRYDLVWGSPCYSSHHSLEDVCYATLREALAAMVETNSAAIPEIIKDLRKRTTRFANTLLFIIYKHGEVKYAKEAANLLCAEPWRFHCGYTDSSYWITCETIAAIVPYCSNDEMQELEKAILSFTSQWEASKDGFRWRGMASYELLSAIPMQLQSDQAKRRCEELKRKFGDLKREPRGFTEGTVLSPIEDDAAQRMTDEQWLAAIAKYDSSGRKLRRDDLLKGGAFEFSSMLEQYTKKDPQRFAKLALRFPDSTNPLYLNHVLAGLRSSSAASSLKLDVCLKAFTDAKDECAKNIVDVLGDMVETLPDKFVNIMQWVATQHSDPEVESWMVKDGNGTPYYGGDMLTAGINTARGRAAEAIGSLIWRDAAYINRFECAVDALIADESQCVRACAARILRATAFHDESLAIQMFKACQLNPQVLATTYFSDFLYCGISKYFEDLRSAVEMMMRSEFEEASRTGSRFAALAKLHGYDVEDIVNEAAQGTKYQRLGVTEVVSTNFVDPEFRPWCEPILMRFFNDDFEEVREQAAKCFRKLEEHPVTEFEELIRVFCDSPAYKQDSISILHMLEKSKYKLPAVTLLVCEKFMNRFSGEAGDIRTSRAGHSSTMSKLVFRTYQQYMTGDSGVRSLEIMDRMILEGVYDAQRGMSDFER